MKPEEFDEAFDKWLKERFKPFRDKQRPERLRQGPLARTRRRPPSPRSSPSRPAPRARSWPPSPATASEGEADIVLLSARDGSVIQNLTKGFTDEFESLAFNDELRGRALHRLRPERRHRRLLRAARASGAACSWSRCSTGKIAAARPARRWTRRRRPACCRTASARSSPPSRKASPTSTSLDLETGDVQEPDPGRVLRHRPPGLPGRQARGLHAAHQRPRQDLRLPAGRPGAQDPAHLRRLRRHRAHLLRRRQRASTTPPPRTTTSTTCAAWTCSTGVDPPVHRRPGRQHGAGAAARHGRGERLAFISYFKGEYRLHADRDRASR